jgi:hypothetical protein
MGEDERRTGDIVDFARAGRDAVEGAPSAGEQGEPSFAQAAQGTLDRVASAGIGSPAPPAGSSSAPGCRVACLPGPPQARQAHLTAS